MLELAENMIHVCALNVIPDTKKVPYFVWIGFNFKNGVIAADQTGNKSAER
jgi:hypothetical protein